MEKTVVLEAKKVDDVLGGADAWKNVDQTDGEKIIGFTLQSDTYLEPCIVLLGFFGFNSQRGVPSVTTDERTTCRFRFGLLTSRRPLSTSARSAGIGGMKIDDAPSLDSLHPGSAARKYGPYPAPSYTGLLFPFRAVQHQIPVEVLGP